MAKKRLLIAGIDVGTTKVCTAIAENGNDGLRLLGTGSVPCVGLRKGVVVNLSETIETIRSSVELAQQQAQREITSAFVSIGGRYISSFNRTGETEVRGRGGEVSPEDIARAVLAAHEKDIPADHEVIHVLTQNFQLDSNDGIENPQGMLGQQLKAHVHVVFTASSTVLNIVNAVNKAGLIAERVVTQQVASSEAVLSVDEKKMGSFVVDIGGGTTDIAVYRQGSIWHTEVLPMGSDLITKDIAITLKAPIREAELLKREAGSVFPESVPDEEAVEIVEVGSRQRRMIPRRSVCEIVQARSDEILSSVAQVIRTAGLNTRLMSGVVLTGGGSLLDGLVARAEGVLNLPVRLGYPTNVVGPEHAAFDPSYATALGLLRYAVAAQDQVAQNLSRKAARSKHGVGGERLWGRLLEMIS